MSKYERNIGKFIPVGVDTENFSDEDFEAYIENGFAIIDGEVYEVQLEVGSGNELPEFAVLHVNEDGSIDFHTHPYNGGAHWTEVIEEALL